MIGQTVYIQTRQTEITTLYLQKGVTQKTDISVFEPQ